MPCPYANLLGTPGQGFHEKRLFGLALNDTLATIFVALLISLIFNTSFLITLLVLFILGEILHYIFGTQTAFLTKLGINACINNTV